MFPETSRKIGQRRPVLKSRGPHYLIPLFSSLLLLSSGPAQAKTDVTFVVGSDLHYTENNTASQNTSARSTISLINALAGKQYPSSVGGGTIATPQFVVVCGDLCNGYTVDSTMQKQFAFFAADWGLTGDKLLKYPVYEGLGNHDEQSGQYIINALKTRNTTRTGINVSSNGLHYSWDRDAVHFIHANLFAGNDVNDVSIQESPPRNSLQFVIDDLKTNVGTSGKPVVIFQHYGWDDFSFYDVENGVQHAGRWWTVAQSDTFYKAIKSYNVIGVFWGHTHSVNITKWDSTIDVYNDGTTQNQDFMVVHINDTSMVVAHQSSGTWSASAQKKKITVPAVVEIAKQEFTGSNSTGGVAAPSFTYALTSQRRLVISFHALNGTDKPMSVSLFNSMGKVVRQKNNIRFLPGENTILFDCSNLAGGIYFSSITIGQMQTVRAHSLR